MQKIITGSRFFIYIAIIGSLISSLALLVYGGIDIVNLIIKLLKVMKFDGEIN